MPFYSDELSLAISIHALTRRATKSIASIVFTYSFQFTLSRGERPVRSLRLSSSCSFQFTLSRGERHIPDDIKLKLFNISIHALTRRATSSCFLNSVFLAISIHALTRRATQEQSAD